MVSYTSEGCRSSRSAISTTASFDTVRSSSWTRCRAGSVTACFRGYFGMYARMRSFRSSESTPMNLVRRVQRLLREYHLLRSVVVPDHLARHSFTNLWVVGL